MDGIKSPKLYPSWDKLDSSHPVIIRNRGQD